MNGINQENRDRKYNEWARRNPAIVSIVFPLLVAVFLFQKYTVELSDVKYVVGALLSFGAIIPALLFFYQSSIREISVMLVETPLFCVFGRPAVNLMKKNNKILSLQRKERILNKARNDGIDADYTDWKNFEEKRERRQLGRETFEMIRETCRDNPIIFEFNCTYGFFRNLSGGIIVDLLLCGVLAYFNGKNQLGIKGILNTSFTILLISLLFCLICTYVSAVRYAKRVYIIYDDRGALVTNDKSAPSGTKSMKSV